VLFLANIKNKISMAIAMFSQGRDAESIPHAGLLNIARLVDFRMTFETAENRHSMHARTDSGLPLTCGSSTVGEDGPGHGAVGLSLKNSDGAPILHRALSNNSHSVGLYAQSCSRLFNCKVNRLIGIVNMWERS
jgi:hypothetical protein